MSRQPLPVLTAIFLHAMIVSGSVSGQDLRLTQAGSVVASKTPVQAGAVDGSSCKQKLAAAKAAFKQGDDDASLELVNAGLSQCPGDMELMEFRGLVLFATGKYQEASTVLHKVLAVRSGWDWATVHNLYPGVETYTRHLRALEDYTRRHPEDGPARFLQAYHYKVGGFHEAAVRQLEMVVRLEYDDPVAVALLKKLSKPLPLQRPPTISLGRY